MKDFRELVKRYIETKKAMPKDHDELAKMKNDIQEQGYDPERIYEAVKDLEPETRDNALEAMFKVIGKEVTWKKPIRINEDGFPSRSIYTKETSNGMERRTDKVIIVAACKRVITEEEIGSQCSICNEYECKDHVFFCNACGRSLCIRHVSFFTNEEGKRIPYCFEHFNETVKNQDTWKTMPRASWKQEREE